MIYLVTLFCVLRLQIADTQIRAVVSSGLYVATALVRGFRRLPPEPSTLGNMTKVAVRLVKSY